MNNFLIRVELHHDEHESDYEKLHDQLYALSFYRVSKVIGKEGWYNLPSGEYLIKETNLDLSLAYTLVENVVVGVLSKHEKYSADQLKTLYSIVSTQVFTNQVGSLVMQVNLQKTTVAKKLPKGETL
jgi:hypothetical protein